MNYHTPLKIQDILPVPPISLVISSIRLELICPFIAHSCLLIVYFRKHNGYHNLSLICHSHCYDTVVFFNKHFTPFPIQSVRKIHLSWQFSYIPILHNTVEKNNLIKNFKNFYSNNAFAA